MATRFTFIFFFLFIAQLLFSKVLKEGHYRGILILDATNHIELPFNFEVRYQNKHPFIIIRNADEKIIADEIRIIKDSLFFKMPVFDTEFKCKINSTGWEGLWISHYRKEKNQIPFKAIFNSDQRFDFKEESFNPALEGKWDVCFSPQSKDSSRAIGVFHHLEQSNYITGTFLTETGDYRYLEGMFHQNKLYLSCFDGSHAFLFIAELSANQNLKGKFYSGAHWQEDWLASKNDKVVLRDPEQITYVKNKNEIVHFNFPDLNNKPVSLDDTKYINRPVIVQIMGTWCPNCMDESRYLAGVYETYNKDGLEILALAFEKTNDFEKAKMQVTRAKNKLKINYNILITLQTGREKASESLPFLNEISAFPTTLFLNKEHKIVKIHTGFSGPATGQEYEVFKKNTEQTILRLLEQ